MAKDKYQETRQRWKKENMHSYNFRLTNASEQDLIDWLESHKPIQAYIKELVRKDMENQN